MELSAQTVLVTGAANGLGRGLAEGFLADGATVVAVDTDAAALRTLGELGAHTAVADVTNPNHVERFVADATAVHGHLDVIVNHAEVSFRRPIEALEADEFERVVRVNLFGPLYVLRAGLRVMRGQGRGRVVNVIARDAELALAGLGGYNASKAALWSLTRTAAHEVEGVDVLVNALIPASTPTDVAAGAARPTQADYPTARMLATLPGGGPNGRCFCNLEEYLVYEHVGRVSGPS